MTCRLASVTGEAFGYASPRASRRPTRSKTARSQSSSCIGPRHLPPLPEYDHCTCLFALCAEVRRIYGLNPSQMERNEGRPETETRASPLHHSLLFLYHHALVCVDHDVIIRPLVIRAGEPSNRSRLIAGHTIPVSLPSRYPSRMRKSGSGHCSLASSSCTNAVLCTTISSRFLSC